MGFVPFHPRLWPAVVLSVFCVTATSVRAPGFGTGVPLGHVNSDAVMEASGLAAWDEGFKGAEPNWEIAKVAVIAW